MVRGGEGFVPFTSFSSGKKCWMYYAPVPSTGWSLAVIFPEDELFADLHQLARNVVLIGLAGFILLVVVITFIARSITRPVRELAVTTEEIAQGNLDIELPQPSSNDEIAALTRSFGEMKVALKAYIANLAETTAARERIESELKDRSRHSDELPAQALSGLSQRGRPSRSMRHWSPPERSAAISMTFSCSRMAGCSSPSVTSPARAFLRRCSWR